MLTCNDPTVYQSRLVYHEHIDEYSMDTVYTGLYTRIIIWLYHCIYRTCLVYVTVMAISLYHMVCTGSSLPGM